jgi:hypothetical protein
MKTVALVPAVLTLAACQANNPTYFGPPAPIEVGQTDVMGMVVGAATSAVTLDFRPPTVSEQETLLNEGTKSGHAVPWLRADHEALELIYTAKNLGDKRATATLLIDGASELVSYDTAVISMANLMLPRDQRAIVLALVRPTPITVEPGETVTGSVGEDDFREAALDLDAIGRWMATPAQVLLNRSETNRIGLERVPAGLVVPAIFRVQVTVAADEHMKFELLLRVRDEDSQLRGGQGGPFQPQPRAYMPEVPPAMMPAAMMPDATTPASM